MFVWVIMFGLSIPSVVLARRTANTKANPEEERHELLEQNRGVEVSTP
jgi:hypothetical protein